MPIVFLDALRKRIYIYVGHGPASNCARQPTKQIVSAQAIAPRDCILFAQGSRPGGIRCFGPAQRRRALYPNEKQRRVTKTEGEQTVTRQSYQQGYVSKPIPTRSGTVFKIRYRVKSAGGKWNHKSETLYGLAGKKAA